MTSGAITPRLFKLAWPLVAGNLLQTAYNLADMFWVGRVGADSVAAVSLMFPTAWMFVSAAMGLTAAANAVVSQHIGAGNERAAERAVGQTILLAVVVAVVLATVGYLGREPLVALIGAEGRVFDLAVEYIEVIFLTIPLTFLFFVFRAVLRAAGDTRTAMWLVAVSAGLNIVIDPVLILGWGPAPAMGVRGAALATLGSRFVAAAVGIYILLDGGWGIRFRVRDLVPDPAVIRRLVDVGYPATFDGLTRSIAAVVFAGLVARFGPAATAAYGIGLRYMSVSWTVSGALGQAVATGVGQNLGARTPGRASEVTWKGTGATMVGLFAIGAVLFAFPAAAMGIFIDDAAVVAEGVGFLRVLSPALAFFGGLMVIQGAFRGAGDTRVAFVLSVLSRWLFRIPAAWLLAYVLPWNATGLWLALAFSSVASFFVGAAWFARGNWQDTVVDEDDQPDDPGAESTQADGPPADDSTDAGEDPLTD
jgi:putative MATE family efflux protein